MAAASSLRALRTWTGAPERVPDPVAVVGSALSGICVHRTAPVGRTVSPVATLATLGDSLRSFTSAVGDFLANLAAVEWSGLLLGLAAFAVYLTLRAYA